MVEALKLEGLSIPAGFNEIGNGIDEKTQKKKKKRLDSRKIYLVLHHSNHFAFPISKILRRLLKMFNLKFRVSISFNYRVFTPTSKKIKKKSIKFIMWNADMKTTIIDNLGSEFADKSQNIFPRETIVNTHTT